VNTEAEGVTVDVANDFGAIKATATEPLIITDAEGIKDSNRNRVETVKRSVLYVER
jgi:hypothetical protein